jgi:hypothetical protein
VKVDSSLDKNNPSCDNNLVLGVQVSHRFDMMVYEEMRWEVGGAPRTDLDCEEK